MSRELGTAVGSAIASGNVTFILLVELDFGSGFVRLTNAPYNFQWNGHTWIGVGVLGSIEQISEGSSLEARGIAFKVSGIPLTGEGDAENISIALGEHYQGRDCRVWVAPLGYDAYLKLVGVSGNYVSTPHSSALDITGDLDVRAKVSLDDWTDAAEPTVVGRWASTGSDDWLFRVGAGGQLMVYIDNAGTQKQSTANTGFENGSAHWIRATVDVDNGASPTGYDVKFYTSEDGASWTQLGATVTTDGIIAIPNTDPMFVGADGDGTNAFAGKIYYAEVRNGIDGEVVARLDPSRDDLGGLQTWAINKSGADHARIVRDPYSVLADPKLIFLGRMDNMEISMGSRADITVHAESRLADLERPRIRRYNDQDQRFEYPDDLGLQFAEAMVEKTFVWGRSR